MTRVVGLMAVSLVMLLGLLSLLRGHRMTAEPDTAAKNSASGELTLYCAASNREVIEAAKSEFERRTGIAVRANYGASQTLLSALQVSGEGDLYLPADDSYLDLAVDQQLLGERDIVKLATMSVVVVVAQDNPRYIATWDDLLRGDVRLVQANPDAAAIGKVTREALLATGQWSPLEARTVAYKGTVNEVANDVALGAADAGIVFDAVGHSYPALRRLEFPELAGIRAHVAIGVLRGSHQRDAARRFAEFLAAADGGQPIYQRFGFQAVER